MEIKRSEIYYADLNPVKGSEQGGVRPVLIIQNDKGNKHSPTTIVAAITSKLDKHRLPTHVGVKMDGLPLNSLVLLEQICTMDKSRILEYVGILDDETMVQVDAALIISIGIKNKKDKIKSRRIKNEKENFNKHLISNRNFCRWIDSSCV